MGCFWKYWLSCSETHHQVGFWQLVQIDRKCLVAGQLGQAREKSPLPATVHLLLLRTQAWSWPHPSTPSAVPSHSSAAPELGNTSSTLKGLGFPGGSDGKGSACSAGDPGSVPGSGRSPGKRNGWQLTPVFSPGKFCGQNFVSSSHFPVTILTSNTLLLSLWHSLLLL